MRAQCIICTDYFDREKDVAAMPCGHTFHEPCLSKWLAGSKGSCPQCRKSLSSHEKPIRRLFFTDPNDSMCTQDDSAKLKSMLDDYRVALKEKDREKEELRVKIAELEKELQKATGHCGKLKSQLRDERSNQSALRKELVDCRQFEAKAQQASSEAAALRTKLRTFESVQVAISGCEKDVQAELEERGLSDSSSGTVRDLALTVILMRRQLDSFKTERRKASAKLAEYTSMLADRKRIIADRDEQIANLTAELNRRDADVQSAEDRCAGLRRRLAALSSAIKSPAGNVGSSLARRLLHESPMPRGSVTPVAGAVATPLRMPVAVAVPSRSPAVAAAASSDSSTTNDGNTTAQLFDDSWVVWDTSAGSTPVVTAMSSVTADAPGRATVPAAPKAPTLPPPADRTPACNVDVSGAKRSSSGGTTVKHPVCRISSVASSTAEHRVAPPAAAAAGSAATSAAGIAGNGRYAEQSDGGCSVREVTNIVGMACNIDAMRKKENGSLFFRKGYNGLGGHGVHVSTPPRPLALPQKRKKRTIILQKKVKPSLSSSSSSSLTIDDFIVID